MFRSPFTVKSYPDKFTSFDIVTLPDTFTFPVSVADIDCVVLIVNSVVFGSKLSNFMAVTNSTPSLELFSNTRLANFDFVLSKLTVCLLVPFKITV